MEFGSRLSDSADLLQDRTYHGEGARKAVLTGMWCPGSDRPQRRTALIGRELGRYNIEIAALSETCLAEEGKIKEVGAGYTFFWSECKNGERREARVGVVIKTHLIGKLSWLPKGTTDCLMTLRLPLSGNRYASIIRYATIISACTPTLTIPDEVNDKFYDDLDSVISTTPLTDKIINSSFFLVW